MSLQAGVATANITPWLGVSVPGGHRARYAKNVDDELLAKALVLDNGSTRVALVTCDLIAMPEKVTEPAKRRIAERCGIPPEHVMVHATHTHTAAGIADLLGTPEDPDYTAWVPRKIADSVEIALHRLRPARVGFATAQEGRISFNRRWHMKEGWVQMNPGLEHPSLIKPAGPIDPEIGIIYVEGTDGTPLAAVACFALHYVGTDDAYAISADYFGHFHRLIQHYLGPQCVGLLWNGTSGDINNIDYSGKRKWPHKGHQQARRMANVLAGHVLTEIQLMEMQETVELRGALSTFAFPRKTITPEDLAVAEKILALPSGTSPAYERGPFSWVVGQPIPKSIVDVYAVECQRLHKLPQRMTAPVQALRIGEAAVVALPGEIFVEIGLDIKRQSPGKPTLVVSLANGYIGYVCTDKALKEHGGYETWAAYSSLGDVGTAPAMQAEALSLLKKVFA